MAALEIVLGIDNLMFVQIVASRCKPEQQDAARKWGLSLALLTRLALLFSISWVAGLVTPIANLWGYELSWRDIILGGGGLFLLVKATMEIHHSVEGEGANGGGRRHLTFISAIIQIAVLDIVFSLEFGHHRGRHGQSPGHHGGGGGGGDDRHAGRRRRRSAASSTITRRSRCCASRSCC